MDVMEKVTSLEELKAYQLTTVVKLPDFAPGKPLVVRLRKPSMLELVRAGQIPNELLSAAVTLFSKGKSVEEEIQNDPTAISKFGGVLEAFVNAAMVEPKLKDMKAAGIELTDEQKMEIFSFTQQEVASLAPFRKKQANPKGSKHSKVVQGKTVSDPGDK